MYLSAVIVWQSDALIDDELRSRLREAVRVLEDGPDAERDWHPGLDEQVLDLVHPSLFCLVPGLSRPDDSTWPSPGPDEARYALSAWDDWQRNRSSVPPDAPVFTPPASPGESARVDLRAPFAGHRQARHRSSRSRQARVPRRQLACRRDDERAHHLHRHLLLVFFLVDPSVTIVSTFRSQLMQERKFFVDDHNEKIYEREFSLCEH
ncbi:MAG TPA: DUF4246 family protein [Trebonia sp.]